MHSVLLSCLLVCGCHAGVDGAGWSEHRLRDGYSYFYNRQTGESQWERPEDFTGQSQDLSREEIQVRRGVGRGGGGGRGGEGEGEGREQKRTERNRMEGKVTCLRIIDGIAREGNLFVREFCVPRKSFAIAV